MRILLAILIVATCTITSCSKTKSLPEDFQDSWSLVNISGGLIGLNCEYEMNEIIWIISSTTIEIENNSQQSGICEYGNFNVEDPTYQIIEKSGEFFLEFDGYNHGLIEIENDNMTINGTFIPNGEVADAFSTSFKRN